MTLFRRRMGFVPEGSPILDAAPERVRAGLKHILHNHIGTLGEGRWSVLADEILRAIRRTGGPLLSTEQAVELLLSRIPFVEVYEIIEYMAKRFRYKPAEFNTYRNGINTVLGDEGVGYRLDENGNLQLATTPEFVEAAALALHEAEKEPYRTYAEQLRRALAGLTFRQLDPTNAAKDAVGALEGVVRARCVGKGDIGDNVGCLNKILHPTLVSALVKVEAYRGDMAAHADRPDRPVSVEEAIFVVHVCSAGIALLAASSSEEPNQAAAAR